MSQKTNKFQLTLSIKRDDVNALVFYKPDGGRFEIDYTIKMKIQTSYKFLITIRPALKVKLALLKGEELLLSNEESTTECSKYSYLWTSDNVTLSKKKSRSNFNLLLEFPNFGVLELPLQFKFYGADDTAHSAWGKCLHHIDYECSHKQGSSFVEMVKQVYR